MILFFVFANVFAQNVSLIDINNNQSLLYTNPSFAGSNGGLRAQSLYQIVNPNTPYTYVGYYAGADTYVKKLKGAFAFTYSGNSNTRGLQTFRDYGLTYAQHAIINNKFKIIPSIQVVYFQNKMSKDFILPPPISGIQPNFNRNNTGFDISGGLLFQYENFYGGISAFNLNRPDVGFLTRGPLATLVNIHASYNFFVSEKMLIQVSGKFITSIGNSLQLNVNTLLFKHFICGMNTLNTEYLGGTIGYRANYFSVTSSYLHNMSGFGGNYNDNVYQLALSYNLRNKENRKKLTAFEAW